MGAWRFKFLLGLSLMLVVLVLYQVLHAPTRPVAPQQALSKIEQPSKPTPIRVLRPVDLEVVETSLEPTGNRSDANANVTHRVLIGNRGKVAYGNINIEIRYLDASAVTLSMRRHRIVGPVSPGSTITLGDLHQLGIPLKTASASVRILFADMEASAAEKNGRPKDR